MAYAGAWRKSTKRNIQYQLVQPIDPQHSTPDENLTDINWKEDTVTPGLPDNVIGDQYLQLPVKGGPLDFTPEDSAFGTGVGHALTQREWQDQILPRHAEDLGATDARRYIQPKQRDGEQHADIIPDSVGDGTPTASGYNATRYVQGYQAANDPGARLGKRLWRWRDRWIDRHMWDAEYRPIIVKIATTAESKSAQSNGNQYTSPYAANIDNAKMGFTSPDKFVAPEERRVPRPWDENMITDGTTDQSAYGLTTWGL